MRKKSPTPTKEWVVLSSGDPRGAAAALLYGPGPHRPGICRGRRLAAAGADAPPPHLKPLIEAAKRGADRLLSPASPPISPPSPWTPGAPPSNSGCGRNCAGFPGARPSPMANWPAGWATPRPPGPWARPTPSTPSPSSSPATGSSRRTAAWGATVRAWTASAGCCAMKGRGETGSGFWVLGFR